MILNLAKQDDYDIACGMRGPDFNHQPIKTMTTAVIRWLAGARSKCWYAHCPPSTAKADWAAYNDAERADIINSMQPHFANHVRYALNALERRGVRGAASYHKWLIKARILRFVGPNSAQNSAASPASSSATPRRRL